MVAFLISINFCVPHRCTPLFPRLHYCLINSYSYLIWFLINKKIAHVIKNHLWFILPTMKVSDLRFKCSLYDSIFSFYFMKLLLRSGLILRLLIPYFYVKLVFPNNKLLRWLLRSLFSSLLASLTGSSIRANYDSITFSISFLAW
jgi:hypothetical protein